MIGTVVTVWLAQPTGDALAPVSTRLSAQQPARIESRSLDDFQLPPKSIFDRSMPRYPNAWFYVERSLAPSYDEAVKFVTNRLRTAMRLREFFGPFDNPEGCDFETTLEHLQPWESRNARALQHAHAFHMRYYYSALAKQQATQVELSTASGKQRVLSLRGERALRSRTQQSQSCRRRELSDLRAHRRIRTSEGEPGRDGARSAGIGAPAEGHDQGRGRAVRRRGSGPGRIGGGPRERGGAIVRLRRSDRRSQHP